MGRRDGGWSEGGKGRRVEGREKGRQKGRRVGMEGGAEEKGELRVQESGKGRKLKDEGM